MKYFLIGHGINQNESVRWEEIYCQFNTENSVICWNFLFIRNGIDQKECERDQKQQKNWGKIQLYFMKFLRIRLEIDQTKLMREMPCNSKFKWGGGGVITMYVMK